jgi:hypothetical protein
MAEATERAPRAEARAPGHGALTVLTPGLLWPRMTFDFEKHRTDRTFLSATRMSKPKALPRRWTSGPRCEPRDPGQAARGGLPGGGRAVRTVARTGGGTAGFATHFVTRPAPEDRIALTAVFPETAG